MASSLKELSYGSVEIYIDETLGIGSYGKVCKAKCGQLPCAAKLLHDTMFQDNDPGINRFLERFQQECQFLSTIKHPNIVQFLRTARNPETGRPVLLMELMDESLTRFLERFTCTIPYNIQLNICHDVALALAYLHSNSIIHRDLSSNNVLLIGAGSRAKVTDFGMSKLTDMNPRMTPLTLCPGTTVYMPPEALTSPPHYSNKLDCFSYGVLTVQIATRKFPNPGDATTFLQDSRFPTGRVIVLIPEIERRKKDFDLIDPDHPLRPVALHCLKDIETERPSADDLCEQLPLLKRERRYTHSVEQSRDQIASVLEFRQKTEEYKNALDAKEVQYQEATNSKERYQRELEQLQLQYQEAVEQHEVQKNMLQHELKESRTREHTLRKELNDTRGQEVLICKERNEASKSTLKAEAVPPKKKSRNVPDPYTIKHETTAGGEVYTMVEKKPKTKKKGKDNLASMYQDPNTIKHETAAGGEVYTMVGKMPKTKKGKDDLASMYQDLNTIKYETAAGGEVYTMVEKNPKTQKGKEERDDLAAMYSMPDKSKKNPELTYADMQVSNPQHPPNNHGIGNCSVFQQDTSAVTLASVENPTTNLCKIH